MVLYRKDLLSMNKEILRGEKKREMFSLFTFIMISIEGPLDIS